MASNENSRQNSTLRAQQQCFSQYGMWDSQGKLHSVTNLPPLSASFEVYRFMKIPLVFLTPLTSKHFKW